MPRITVGRVPRLAALLGAALLGLALAATASADTPPGRGPGGGPPPTPTPPAGPCAVLHVQLNGNRPPTHTCLVEVPDAQQTGPSVQPTQSALTTCGSTALQLWVDTNFGGATLCITGGGTLDLSYHYYYEWWGPWHVRRSWTDKLSSFRTGYYYVNFYEHKDWGGAKLTYAPYQWRASMPSGWNDRVSSVCVYELSLPCP